MYRVIHRFADLEDHKHLYVHGDVYPREGLEVTAERIEELLSAKNKMGKPLIEKVQDPEPKVKEEPKEKERISAKKKKAAD